MAFFNFANSNTMDIDLSSIVKPSYSYFLTITHNGANNHNYVFFLSGYITPNFKIAKLISDMNLNFNVSISAIDIGVIRITIDANRQYGGRITITQI